MPTVKRCVVVAAVFGSMATSFARAADRDVDEKAVRDRTVKLAAALGAGDAKAVAAFWTDEGEYASEEASIRGRTEIEQAYQTFFEKRPGLDVEVESASVRFLGKDTAIEEGRFHLETKDGPTGHAAFSVLYVREDGDWRIARLQESPDVPGLHDLDWLVGAWRAKTEEATVETKYEFVHGGTFLKMEYVVKTPDGESSGSQMIGMDPALGMPRSWLFTGDGGFGAGVWTRDGKTWKVEASGRTPDGGETSSVNVVTPVDGDSFTWQSTQRVVDGEEQPDGDKITVTRVKGE